MKKYLHEMITSAPHCAVGSGAMRAHEEHDKSERRESQLEAVGALQQALQARGDSLRTAA
jgi:hypothetical protein